MFAAVAPGVESEDPTTGITVRRMLESAGIPARTAAEFYSAFEKAARKGNVDPLNPWLSHSDDRVRLIAAAGMFDIEPVKAEQRLVKLIKSGKSSSDVLVLTLAMSEKKETIDYLVQRVSRTKDPSKEPAIAALQIRTGRTFSKSSEWVEWWKNERAKFKRPHVSDPVEFMQRLQVVRMGEVFRDFSPLIRDSKAADALKSVGSIFEQLAAGQSLEFSEETLRGVEHFCRGEFAEALAAYEEALKVDQFDRVAVLDSACLLLEAGRFDEAAKAFERLGALIPDSPLIANLQKLAESKSPSSEWLESLRRSVNSDKEKRDLISEPLLSFLLSRAMSKAKLEISKATIEEILSDPSKPFRLQLGAALASSKMLQTTWLTLVRTRFPESPVAQGWCFLASIGSKGWDRECAEACSRWAVMEPDNVVPKVGLVALKVKQPKDSGPTPVIRGALLDELDQALAAPNLNFHIDEANDAVRQVIAETKFPFPSITSAAGGQLSGLMLRLARGVAVEKEDLPKRIEDAETFTRSHEVFALLVRRFPPEMFLDGVAKVGATSLAGMVLQMEKALAQLKGEDASVVESLDQRKKALRDDATPFTKNPDSELPLIPLPSVHRALYEGQQSSR
jgi:tetratricopeptide (TPR) repeat protein